MSLLKLWRQNPKSWFAWRYIKTCGRCFRMTLQNSLTIFDNVLLWTPYKSLMLCHPSSLPKLCNDIAIISWTGTVTLKQVSYFLKYGPNLSHKTLNVIRTCYSRSFPNFFLRPRTQQQLVYNSCHPFLTPYAPLLRPIISLIKLKIANFFHSPCKISAWIATTCFTIMYKNMYNPKSKTIFLPVSSIAEILGENKQKPNDKMKWRQVRE